MPLNQTRFLDQIRAAVRDTVDDRMPWHTLMAPVGDQAVRAALTGRTREQRLALLHQLIDNAGPLGLHVHPCATLAMAAGNIASIASASEPEFHPRTALLLHDHPLLRALPLDDQPALVPLARFWTQADDSRVRAHTLAASIGITVVDWGIAESATIAQVTRPGLPRSTSLVPSVHIALLPLANLVADLAEAFALIRNEPDRESLVLISGPSKTADIEACMVLGAHGPRAMHLLVLTGPDEYAAYGFPIASCCCSC